MDPTPIPKALMAEDRWVVWRSEDRGREKPTKVPYAASGGPADSTDPATWASYMEALTTLQAAPDHLDGLGFVLGDGWAGLDLDDCRDPESGEVANWARELAEALDSYTEVSPSGTGLKVFVRASGKPGPRCRTAVEDGEAELYTEARYFTVTGQHLEGTPLEVHERDEAVAGVYGRLFPDDQGEAPPTTPTVSSVADLPDWKLLAHARTAANGAKFHALYDEGDTDGYRSGSEADAALCQMLAFWVGKDPERVDRLFRASALYRDKWERADYRQRTLDQAFAKLRSTWSGSTTDLGLRLRIVRTQPVTYELAWPNGPWIYVGPFAGLLDRRNVARRFAEHEEELAIPGQGLKRRDQWTEGVLGLFAGAERVEAPFQRHLPLVMSAEAFHQAIEQVEEGIRSTGLTTWEGGVTLFFAPPKAGKSTVLASHIVHAVRKALAAGAEPPRIVWITEMDARRTALYLNSLMAEASEEELPYLHAGSGQSCLSIVHATSPEMSWEALERHFDAFGPDQIIVDTLDPVVSACEGELPEVGDKPAWQAFYSRYFSRWAQQWATGGVVIADHTTKADPRQYIGSTGKASGCDVMLWLEPPERKPPHGGIRKLCAQGRGVPAGYERLLKVWYPPAYARAGLTAHFLPLSEEKVREIRGKEERAREEGEAEVLIAVINFLDANPGASARAIEKGVTGFRTGEPSNARDYLESLDLAENRMEGRAHHWYLTGSAEEAREGVRAERAEMDSDDPDF